MNFDPQEADDINRAFRVVAAAAAVLLAGGVMFYHFWEHMNWVDAFYFSTVTLSTVGYGDITPKTDVGKIFTAFYILSGVGIIATFASLVVKNAAVKRVRKLEAKRERNEQDHT